MNTNDWINTEGKRPFVFNQPAVPGEEVPKMIVLTATNSFGREEYPTPLAPAQCWYINFTE